MAALAVSLVVLSGLVHSTWNLFAKKSRYKNAFLWHCQWMAIVFFSPWVLEEIGRIPTVSMEGWLLLAASMILHGAYVVLLANAYALGDLSQVYPIMRGTSPLLVPIAGVFLLSESLKAIGWIGIACIVTGIFLTGNFKANGTGGRFNPALLLAMLVGVAITSYTVVDKMTLEHFPAMTLNIASNIGNLLALSYFAFRSEALRSEWSLNWRTILLGGILAPGGYILFLNALEMLPVSQLAPMREIGTVFGTLMGIFILRESRGTRRIVASVIITAGVVLLAQ